MKKVPRDRLTEKIAGLLGSIPRAGKYLMRLYLWKPLMFNFMLVGASGTVLSYLLYEGLFRRLLIDFWGGAFLGMVITTILVFLWNFTWNKAWSLKPAAQIMSMKKRQLLELRIRIDDLLTQKFDAQGNRID